MSITAWETKLHALLEEFWKDNNGQITKYQASFGDGTKFTIAYSKKKRPPTPTSGGSADGR